MAKSTFLELVQKSALECGEANTPSTVVGQTNDYLQHVRFIQDADVEIQGLWFDWDFLHVDSWTANTVAGTAAVSAPADIGVWDTDSFYLDYSTATYKKLAPLDYREWRKNYRNGVKTNQKPSRIVVMPDQSLTLEAPPDDVYALTADYWKKPAKMTADDSTSPIPEEYERIIIAKAKIAYGERYAASEVLQAGQIEYDFLLDKLESKYLSNQIGRRMGGGATITVIPE